VSCPKKSLQLRAVNTVFTLQVCDSPEDSLH